MKKIILIITIFFMTGCLGQTAKGYITKTCEKHESINGNTLDTNIKIVSKQGEIETIEINEIYDRNLDIEAITVSKKSEQNLYKTTTGVNLYIEDNKFKYEIKPKELKQEMKERLNIKEEQHKQIKYYEDNGYTCQ